MMKVWLGPMYVFYSLHHPELIGQILKSPKNEILNDLLRPWIGDGLLISEGRKWFRNRRLLTPAFHYEILKPYVHVYNNCVEVMLEKWKAEAEKGEPVKVFESVSLLSLDVVLQCAFSHQSHCQHEGKGQEYVRAVQRMTDLIVVRSLNIFSYMGWIYWWTAQGREMARCCKTVHDHSEDVIRKRKDTLSQSGNNARKYLDFLDILLTAQDEDGKGLTDAEIRDEADTFMFEGHDTTTSGMSWTLYCLAQYPEHQDKIREEVRNVLMGREWLEYEDLKKLEYTTWCIKEAMRLYPPVMSVYRRLSEDTDLEGVTLPKGSKIEIAINNLHHNPQVWENPDEFKPSSFPPYPC